MALTLVLPALVYCAFLVTNLAAQQRAQFDERLRQQAANFANAFDRDTERLLTVLDTLAVSGDLWRHDFAAFHADATFAVARLGTFIVVSDGSGQQLINTRVPYGTVLPKPPLADD